MLCIRLIPLLSLCLLSVACQPHQNTGNPSPPDTHRVDSSADGNKQETHRSPAPERRDSSTPQVDGKKQDTDRNVRAEQQAPRSIELEGDALLQSLDRAAKEGFARTANEFKAKHAAEKYLDTLNSYRGKQVILRLKVVFVAISHTEVAGLTLDPDFDEKDLAIAQRQLRGETVERLPPTAYVHLDFSGIDRGTTRLDLRVDLRAYQPSNFKRPLPDQISNDKLDPKILPELDKDHVLLCKGRIVSLTPFSPGYYLSRYQHILLSLEPNSISVVKPGAP